MATTLEFETLAAIRQILRDRGIDDEWIDAATEPTAEEIAQVIAERGDEYDCETEEEREFLAAADLMEDRAYAAQEAAESEDREEEFETYQALESAKDAVLRALTEKRIGHVHGSTSQYFQYAGLVTVRVSDHEQPADGGYSIEMGCRHGASDVSIVVESSEDIPSREEIREMVADALRAARG